MEAAELSNVLILLKANLGITTTGRDELLKKTIESTYSEFSSKGIKPAADSLDEDADLIMLIVDYASWQYRSRGESAMPRNIQYRMRNRIVKGVVASE